MAVGKTIIVLTLCFNNGSNMIERALEVLIRFANNSDCTVKLADVELEHKLIHLSDFSLHSDDIYQYKKERELGLSYLASTGLTRFFKALNVSDNNVGYLIVKIFKYSSALSNHQPNYNSVPKHLIWFLNKDIGYYICFVFSIIVSILLISLDYNLFWYDFLLTISFSYIFVDRMNKYAYRIKCEVDEENKKIDEEISIIVQEYNELLKINFTYEELKYISKEIHSNRFFRNFSYVKMDDFIDFSTSVDLLDRANRTIRKANARISELKVNLSNKEFLISNLQDEISKLNSGNYNKYNEESPYEILGVKFGETDKSIIKLNYKKLSNIYHYDRSGSNAMMKKINLAYDKIK